MCANVTDKGPISCFTDVNVFLAASCCLLLFMKRAVLRTGVLAVATACQRLEQMYLRECPLVTQAGISTLQEAGIRISRA